MDGTAWEQFKKIDDYTSGLSWGPDLFVVSPTEIREWIEKRASLEEKWRLCWTEFRHSFWRSEYCYRWQ